MTGKVVRCDRIMGPKKDGNHVVRVKRRNTNIMIDVKKDIIAKHENGVRVSDLAIQFGMAKSTICTILKNRETIKNADVARGVSVITKQRSQTIEDVEKLLLIWINENMLAGNSITENMICEKARELHVELVKQYPERSSDSDCFKASRGWFEKFKRRSGIFSSVGKKNVPTTLVGEMCAKWDELQSFVERYHPDKAVANHSINIFNDNVMCHFRNILQPEEDHFAVDHFLVGHQCNGYGEEAAGAKKRKRRKALPTKLHVNSPQLLQTGTVELT